MEILIVPNKPYMITTNLDVMDGIVNGALGSLKLCERRLVVLMRWRLILIPGLSGRDGSYVALFPVRYTPRRDQGYERALYYLLIQMLRAVKKTYKNVSSAIDTAGPIVDPTTLWPGRKVRGALFTATQT